MKKTGNLYEGEFKERIKHGSRVYKWFTGEIYNKQWKDGIKERHGIHVQPDEAKYSSDLNNGEKYRFG